MDGHARFSYRILEKSFGLWLEIPTGLLYTCSAGVCFKGFLSCMSVSDTVLYSLRSEITDLTYRFLGLVVAFKT